MIIRCSSFQVLNYVRAAVKNLNQTQVLKQFEGLINPQSSRIYCIYGSQNSQQIYDVTIINGIPIFYRQYKNCFGQLGKSSQIKQYRNQLNVFSTLTFYHLKIFCSLRLRITSDSTEWIGNYIILKQFGSIPKIQYQEFLIEL